MKFDPEIGVHFGTAKQKFIHVQENTPIEILNKDELQKREVKDR